LRLQSIRISNFANGTLHSPAGHSESSREEPILVALVQADTSLWRQGCGKAETGAYMGNIVQSWYEDVQYNQHGTPSGTIPCMVQ
jgi:hypothetical protein